MKKRLTILAVLAMAVCISSTMASASDTKAAKAEKAPKVEKAPKAEKAPKVAPVVAVAAPVVAVAAPVVAAPAVTAAGSVFATLTATKLTLNGMNLVPGTRYAYTFQVWSHGSAYAKTRGGSDGTVVKADGTYSTYVDIDELMDWAGPAGLDRVVMWLRPVNSVVGDVALNADGAPLLVEQDFTL